MAKKDTKPQKAQGKSLAARLNIKDDQKRPLVAKKAVARTISKNPLFKRLQGTGGVQKKKGPQRENSTAELVKKGNSLAVALNKTINDTNSSLVKGRKRTQGTSRQTGFGADQISFKSTTPKSSGLKFLRIYNIDSDTTEAEVSKVVSKVAPVSKTLLKSQHDGRLMAEVFFKNRDERILAIAFDTFDSKSADGNVLRCEIDHKSKVLSRAEFASLQASL